MESGLLLSVWSLSAGDLSGWALSGWAAGLAVALGAPDWKLVVNAWPFFAAATAFGYLAGSIPSGLVLTRLAGLGDIRQTGSGNIGATNVLRTGRKDLAALTLVLDLGKGALAAGLVQYLYGPDLTWFAALAAVLGHMFPVWLAFRGGKGVATAAGVTLVMAWPVALIAAATWLLLAVLFRYASLASIVAAAATPLAATLLHHDRTAGVTAILALLVVWKHRGNIRRLVTGQEPRIGRARPDHVRSDRR